MQQMEKTNMDEATSITPRASLDSAQWAWTLSGSSRGHALWFFFTVAGLSLPHGVALAQPSMALVMSPAGEYIGQGQTYYTTNPGDISDLPRHCSRYDQSIRLYQRVRRTGPI